ncbi:MAG: hypothetical protein GX059_05195 [Clostridiales bacterium]|nr:hypothetical protein [Clostridiales bacterium]
MKLFRRKETIQFSGRSHTKGGILSFIIGMVTVLGFIAVCIISGVNNGEGGILIGVTGILLFVLAAVGLVLAYREMKKRDIFYRFPMIGIITNGFMLILLAVIYILGLY